MRAYIEKKPQPTIIKVADQAKVEENGNTIISNGNCANGTLLSNGSAVSNGKAKIN